MRYKLQTVFIVSFSFLALALMIAVGLKATPRTIASGITITPSNTPASLFLPAAPYVIVTNTPPAISTIAPTATGTITVTPTKTITPTVTHTATPSPTSSITPTPSPTVECDYGPYALPYHLQFEDYTCGGEGIAYHDADPANNGGEYRLTEGVDLAIAISPRWGDSYYVGWTEEGEWLTYHVNLMYSENYYFRFIASSLYDSSRFHLEVDGVDVTGSLTVPHTENEQDWQSVVAPEGIFLESGYHTLKLVIESGGGNFDFLRIYPGTPTPTLTPSPTSTPVP